MANHAPATRVFDVTPPSARTMWTLPALWVVLVAVVFALRHEVLLHANPAVRMMPAWLPAMSALTLPLLGSFILLHYRRIQLADGMLSIRAAGMFGHRVAVAELDLERARIVDLDEHTDLKPGARLWGMGLPGFSAGHYLLRNRARAFCLLTRRDKVLALPRRDGRYILLSPEKPQELLQGLREAAGQSRG